MAKYTNVTVHAITMPDGTMLAPGVTTEIADAEATQNQRFKEMVDAKEIIAGELSPEDRAKWEQQMANPTFQQPEQPDQSTQPQQQSPRPQPQQPTPPQPQQPTKAS